MGWVCNTKTSIAQVAYSVKVLASCTEGRAFESRFESVRAEGILRDSNRCTANPATTNPYSYVYVPPGFLGDPSSKQYDNH